MRMYAFLVSLLFILLRQETMPRLRKTARRCWVRWDLRSPSARKWNMRVIDLSEDNSASHPPFPRLSLDLQARPVPWIPPPSKAIWARPVCQISPYKENRHTAISVATRGKVLRIFWTSPRCTTFSFTKLRCSRLNDDVTADTGTKLNLDAVFSPLLSTLFSFKLRRWTRLLLERRLILARH